MQACSRRYVGEKTAQRGAWLCCWFILMSGAESRALIAHMTRQYASSVSYSTPLTPSMSSAFHYTLHSRVRQGEGNKTPYSTPTPSFKQRPSEHPLPVKCIFSTPEGLVGAPLVWGRFPDVPALGPHVGCWAGAAGVPAAGSVAGSA